MRVPGGWSGAAAFAQAPLLIAPGNLPPERRAELFAARRTGATG
ncbi:hypothetical protein ACWD48_11340 [Streptomyces sp. NPDC002519]